jgi:hypothetical protein
MTDSVLLSSFTAQASLPAPPVRASAVIAISCTLPFADRAP